MRRVGGGPWPGLTSSLKSSFRRIGVRTPCFSSPTFPPPAQLLFTGSQEVQPGRVARLLAHYLLSAYQRVLAPAHFPTTRCCQPVDSLGLWSAGLQGTVTNLPGLQPEWGAHYLPPGQWGAVKELGQTCQSSEPGPHGAGGCLGPMSRVNCGDWRSCFAARRILLPQTHLWALSESPHERA